MTDRTVLKSQVEHINKNSKLVNVIATRKITTVPPLIGGGDLSDDITLSIPKATQTSSGYMSLEDKTKLDGLASTGGVPTTRTISTTAPLSGGGDLSANRTLTISPASSSAAGSMSASDKTKLDAMIASAGASGVNQTLPSGGLWTAIVFNSELWDTNNILTLASSTTRMTIVTAGVYMITGNASFDALTTGYRALAIYKNGSIIAGLTDNGAAIAKYMNVSIIDNLNIGDYIELYGYTNLGSNTNINSPRLSLARLP